MKKQQVRKIVLNKETLRHLNGEKLTEVAGGTLTQNGASVCVETCKICQFTQGCPYSYNC
jgi:hypothetical protein